MLPCCQGGACVHTSCHPLSGTCSQAVRHIGLEQRIVWSGGICGFLRCSRQPTCQPLVDVLEQKRFLRVFPQPFGRSTYPCPQGSWPLQFHMLQLLWGIVMQMHRSASDGLAMYVAAENASCCRVMLQAAGTKAYMPVHVDVHVHSLYSPDYKI